MTSKAPFCASLRLIRAVLGRLLNKAISMALWTKVITCDKAGFKSRFCQVHKAGKIGVNQRNPRLINDLQLPPPVRRRYLCAYKALYICRDKITDVVSALQIQLFMQNEPNFRKSQVNVTDLLIRNYEQMDTWSIRKNEPKTNPNEPKTNPILANKTPERTQFQDQKMPNLTITYRPYSFAHYENRRLFNAEYGLNPSFFVALSCAKALIFGKKMLPKQIPDKATAALCRFVYIRKALYLYKQQGIITADFRCQIENKHGQIT